MTDKVRPKKANIISEDYIRRQNEMTYLDQRSDSVATSCFRGAVFTACGFLGCVQFVCEASADFIGYALEEIEACARGALDD